MATPKRFPIPSEKPKDLEEVSQYLFNLVKEISDAHAKTITGPVSKHQYAPSNYTIKADINAGAATLADVANVLCTLIKALQDGGVLR